MVEKKARRKETDYGKRVKRRKSLAGKIGGNGYFSILSGKNKGTRMPKPLSILLGLAREKSVDIEVED